MSTASCCCCCGARSASSRCCVDYSRLSDMRRQSTPEHRRPSSTEPPSSPLDVPCSSVPRPCVNVQPILHEDDDDDDDDEMMIDGVYDGGTSSASRPTVLRLTTFKPSLRPPPPVARRPRAETIAEDGVPVADKAHDEDISQTTTGIDENRATSKQLSTTSTTSSVSVITTAASAVLDRLQPDLLPLMSTAALTEDSSVISAMTYGPDDLS